MTFPRGDYYDFDGEPHCEIHYHAQRGTLCAQCQKPITGMLSKGLVSFQPCDINPWSYDKSLITQLPLLLCKTCIINLFSSFRQVC